ncbi:undecaprenyl-diphosphatase [Austwickia chelonae]|uniref:Undecaprenyl-diphosphatase n=1 Tax=Austwickia chelonae NBRC 105200 TaxID=1184607 RepID=K6VP42_9MICO|nr:undecaprenyl-diphosphate phosphatase [Austwickia chelonae]GAB77135.1 undecaprenyl-diphosphatase [Austwickia chelonae NBRC 105200]SEW03527.1 undecaprenyl-diphosphatase [Austwickia chelonae]
MELTYVHAVILGIVEGITEYLPISSTGHLTVVEKMMGLQIDDPAVTGYTATIQIGAIAATLVFFWGKISRLFFAWVDGIRDERARDNQDWTLAWAVIIGSLPVGIVGFLGRKVISGSLRSLWVVAAALVLWSIVMWVAEMRHDQDVREGTQRAEDDVTIRDGIILGVAQCFSLVPGVSRSGATISAGLFTGLNRVVATELSFFMAIPALTAAGLYGLKDVDFAVVPLGPMIVGIVVSFFVAYASIAWLLRFVASNSLKAFVYYRVPAGLLLAAAVGAGWISAT